MLSFALNMTYYLKQKDEGEKIMKIYRQGAILALIAAAAVTGCGGKGNSQNAGQPVLQVNDYLVGEEEYDFFCSLYKAQASADFWAEYGIDVSGAESGWDTPNQQGLTARQYMNQLAEKEIVRYAVILSAAKERRIPVTESYDAMKQRLEEINTAGSGVSGYGMSSWNMQNLFSYLYTDMEASLKKELAEKEFVFTEEELREHYETMDHSAITLRGSLKAEVDLFYYISTATEEERVYQEQQLQKIAADLEAGGNAEELVKKEQEDGTGLTVFLEQEISTEAVGRDDLLTQAVLTELYERAEGDIVSGDFAGVPCVFRVRQLVKDGGRFEDSRDKVEADMINIAYDDFINQAVEDASVVRFSR